MTELKTKHRGEPALNFLRAPDLPERIDAAIKDGSINEIMESAKFLAILISVGENSDYWKKELNVTPNDIRLLQKLTEIDGGNLDIFGQKTLKVLVNTIIQQSMIFVDRVFPKEGDAPTIPKDSIYESSDRALPFLKDGEPAEFGVYHKGQPFNSVVTEFFQQNQELIKNQRFTGKPNPVCEAPITKNDLAGLDFDAISGNYQMFTAKAVKLIMDSPKAFSEVSKKEFATAYLKAAEQPRALGMFAIIALSNLYAKNTKGTTALEEFAAQETVGKLATKVWNISDSYRGQYLLSAKEFTVKEFAANPFTVEELKALPFLLGQHKEVYAEVKHDHAIHAQSCAEKLRSSGFGVAADVVLENAPEKAVKPVRKHDDLSPGM